MVQQVFPAYQYSNLEDIEQRKFAKEDPKGFLGNLGKKVIIDEILKNHLNRNLRPKAYFWKATGAHEIDLLLDRGGRGIPEWQYMLRSRPSRTCREGLVFFDDGCQKTDARLLRHHWFHKHTKRKNIMVNTIIAILLIFTIIVLTGVTIFAFIQIKRMGLFKTFMQGQWVLGLLSLLFVASFIGNAIGLLLHAEWAEAGLRYTIYLWLVYVWAYGLNKLLGMAALLHDDEAKSVSQLMGRSKLFDEVLEKSIELSRTAGHATPEDPEEAHAASDPEWEALINDEEWFREVLPTAVRKKVKRKFTGLLFHTAFFVIILLLL